MTDQEIFKLKEDLANHVVKTTQHLVLIDPNTKMPFSGGSGCLIIYKERLFLVSVQHVTDKIGKETCIDLGKTKDDGTDLYNVGAMNYVDQYRIEGLDTVDPELIELKPLDLTYVEIKGDLEVFQKERQFGEYKITAGNKQMHYAETPEIPNKNECYSFFGRIRGKLNGNILEQQEKLVFCIKYDCKIENFERFLLHENITDPFDYKGTSGAPIISETGEIVAFVSKGIRGTNHLYGFSSAELKKFLDIYIEQNPVE